MEIRDNCKCDGLYQALLTRMPVGFSYNRIVLDQNGDSVDFIFVEINDAFQQYTGLMKEQVIGKSSFDINIWIDPEERAKIAEVLVSNGSIHNMEVKFRVRSGNILTFLMSVEIITVNGIQCVISALVDITSRKKQRRSLGPQRKN